MSQDFSKAKIYKITNDFNNEIYIGSTCGALNKRFSNHKAKSKMKNMKNPLYKLMNEIGFDRFRIDLVEEWDATDKQDVRQKEGKYIRELGTLNINIAGRSQKEYYIENQDDKKQYFQEQYRENKEEKKQYNKNYYDENKIEINLNRQEYSKNNKSKISDMKKKYYVQNRESILEKQGEEVTCICGCTITRHEMSRHK